MSQLTVLEAAPLTVPSGPELWRVLPPELDLEKSAKATGALQRPQRKLRDAEDLLRLVLAYGFCGLSMRDVAAWAKVEGIAELSDVAVLKAVRKCGDWLAYLIGVVLARRFAVTVPLTLSRRVRLIDASAVSEPGSTKIDWRLHLGYDLSRGWVDEVHVTTGKTGEHLGNFSLKPGEVAIADRGYATRSGLASILVAGADFIVRLNWRNVPLRTRADSPFDLLKALRSLKDQETGDFEVAFQAPDGRLHPVRLVAQRLPREKALQAKARIEKERRRKGTVDPATLETAGYLFVLTSLSQAEAAATDVLQLYRLRWQVELVFKRLKSLVGLDQLPADHPQTARTFLLAKVLGALLVEERAIEAVSVFPPGHGDGAFALPTDAMSG